MATDTTFPRLSCPTPKPERYDGLRQFGSHPRSVRPKYFFALDLHQCLDLLPRLLGSIVESILFLGPENCALSVVQGRSTDGTLEVLELLREKMEDIGVAYYLESNDLSPKDPNSPINRIEALANLRNEALAPLINHPDEFSSDTAVIFLNDVALCMEDILELMLQRVLQGADMVCALDWTFPGWDPTFYDVWIARSMSGDSFFHIPANGSWDDALDLFWDHAATSKRFVNGQPFQVFSCWNGGAVFTAKPLMENKIKFRFVHDEHECYQGEPQLFCKDFWWHGYGKIAVVPIVSLEYNDENAQRLKATFGYVSDWLEYEELIGASKIEWNPQPPELIKCMPNYHSQYWVPWNEGQAVHDPL